MATELTDEEVFGNRELSDEEVFGGAPVAPPEAPKRGGNFLEILGNVSQSIGPAGALVSNPVAGVGPQDAPEFKEQWKTAMAANLAAAKTTLPIAASLVAPVAAAAVAPAAFGLAGATSLSGYVGSLLASGAVSGFGGGVTRQGINLAAGDATPGQAAKDVALETGLGAVANVAIGGIGSQLISGAAGAIGSKGARLGGFVTGALQRPWINKAEQQVQAARDVVKKITGMAIPESPGEILGEAVTGTSYLAVEKSLRGVGGLTPEARDVANRAVLYAAVEHAGGTGMSTEELAKAAMQELRSQTGPIGRAATKAVEEFAGDLHGSVTRAVKAQQSAAGNLFETPTPETPFSGGGKLKDMASSALAGTKKEFDAAYSQVRSSPLYKEPVIQPSNAGQWADELEPLAMQKTVKGEQVAYDQYGNPSELGGAEGLVKPIPSTLPEGTQKFFSEVRQFASTPQSLESMRVFQNKISRSIKDNNILPGIGTYEKIGLLKAISADIDESLAPLADPILANLKSANKLYSENIDRFKGAFESGIIRDIGAEKGATAESVYSSLTGSSGTSKLSQLKNLLGKDYDAGLETLRNTVKPELIHAATDVNGQLNVGKLFAQARELPAELFPQLTALQKIAQAEAKLAGLKVPKDPEAAFAWYKKDPQAFDEFLQPGGEAKFQAAYRADLANQEAFKNAANAAVKRFDDAAVQQNPEGFVDLVVNKGIPSADVAKAMTVWRDKAPEVARNMEVAFMENLLSEVRRNGLSDVSEMAKMLSAPTAGTKAPLAGKFWETSMAILGQGKTADLKTVTDAMAKVALKNPGDKSILQSLASDESADAGYLIARKAGYGAPVSIVRRVFATLSYTGLKYRLAAKWITESNPALRDLISKPITKLTPEEAATFADLLGSELIPEPRAPQQ